MPKKCPVGECRCGCHAKPPAAKHAVKCHCAKCPKCGANVRNDARKEHDAKCGKDRACENKTGS